MTKLKGQILLAENNMILIEDTALQMYKWCIQYWSEIKSLLTMIGTWYLVFGIYVPILVGTFGGPNMV